MKITMESWQLAYIRRDRPDISDVELVQLHKRFVKNGVFAQETAQLFLEGYNACMKDILKQLGR